MTLTEIITAAIEVFTPLAPFLAVAIIVIFVLVAIMAGLVVLAMS